MAVLEYDDQSTYDDLQGADTGCCDCPTGTLAVYTKNGDCRGCVTPKDAASYENQSYVCPDGYVKVFDPQTEVFVGCLTESEAEAYYSARSTT